MPLIAVLLTLAAHAGAPGPVPPEPPAPGISAELARQRAARISALRYAFTLHVPPRVDERIHGEEVLRFELSDASAPLALDFEPGRSSLLGVEAGGRPVEVTAVNGHLVVPASALRRGRNELRLRFLAGDASLNRNPDYLYTLFVPARASAALPVFDQPDLKARFTLTLEVPKGWETLANGPETSRERTDSTVTVHFAETKPIPTYLFAFVAGKWKIETATRSGRTLRMFHRETDAAKVARNRDAIFDLVDRSIRYMERYTGIPYPFAKYDFVAVPSFQFGGMEHPGQVLYQASSLLLDASATQNQKLGRASVIAHETAHMWFGDLVTMKWFDDVWMKEVMANFMAAKIVNPSFPEVNHELRFLLAHYPAAYAVDRTAGTHPIRQRLDNLNEAGQLYGNIIYDKAPIVMRQLEQLVGEDRFREGMRRFLKAHEYGNASWPDMIDVLDGLAPEQKLKAWSHVWVEEAGRPTIDVDVIYAEDGRSLLHVGLGERDPAGKRRAWPEPTTVAVIDRDAIHRFPARLGDGPAEVRGIAGTRANIVLPNGDGRAYGLFLLDGRTRAQLLRHLPDIPDPVVRGAAWLDLWDDLLEGDVAPAAFADLALRAVDRESDEQLTQRMLGSLDDAFWHFLTPAQRQALAPGLEALLWRKLAAAPTVSRKAAYFSALRSVALTPAAVDRLRRVWASDTVVEGLPLSEQDLTSLALELAVRGLPDADSILAAQQARIRNPDRKARLAFVSPALSADPAVRDRWFQALREPENRRHEPWVAEGLAYLNHPLRAAASEKYVRPSLELLEEVRRTGDIFFPGRWMGAALSGHTSPEAAAAVRAFLAEHPDYPVRLRQIVLQAADELFRAARITAAPGAAAGPAER